MVKELDFDVREASKFLASLEVEHKGRAATIGILRSMTDAKRTLDRLNNTIKDREGVLERYKKLIGLALKDAEEAESGSLLRIGTANAKELKKNEEVNAAIDSLTDKLKFKVEATEQKIAECDNEVKARAKSTYEKVNTYIQEEQDALTKRDQALVALEEVGRLVGGRK